MTIPVPRSLSPSRIETFRSCALAFRFGAIDGRPEPATAATLRGTLTHRVLERLFERPASERTRAHAHVQVAALEADFAHTVEWREVLSDGVDADELIAEVADLVDRYFTLEDPTGVVPIGLELRMRAVIDGVELHGVIDRLEVSDSSLIVTDYKTGRAPRERHERQRMEGVGLYALLCEHMLGVRPDAVQLLYLEDPVAIVAPTRDQAMSGVAQRLRAVHKAIEVACADDDFRPHPSALCDWCAHRAACPAWSEDAVIVGRAR